MAEESKTFLGLLNGITKHDYYEERDIEDIFLKQELYPEMPSDDFQKLTTRSRGLIKSMAVTHMDMNQTEIFLTSQTKKKDGAITADQAKVLLKFWKTHRSKIHEILVERCSWNNKLKNMSWRIDVPSQAKNTEQPMMPIAIVELQLENRESENMNTEVLQFEMDETIMGKVLHSLKEIEEQLHLHNK